MAGTEERFDKQAIHPLSRQGVQIETCKVDPPVPSAQQLEIGLERRGQTAFKGQTRQFGSFGEQLCEGEGAHSGVAEAAGASRPINAPSTATAAGVMPGMRAAWPRVS